MLKPFIVQALSAIFGFFGAVPFVSPAAAGIPLDQSTKDYLEGAWLTNEQPKGISCTKQNSSNSQYEFEFRKSGGRFVWYEPFDVFTGVGIFSAQRDGDVVTITFAGPDQKAWIPIHIRLMPPDRLEFLDDPVGGDTAPSTQSTFAYRCDRPNWTVTNDLSVDMERILTSPATGTTLFVEVGPRLTDTLICRTAGDESLKPRLRWLQFEIIGPVHYYVFGVGFGHKLDLQPIRSVRPIDNHTFAIEVQERSPSAGGLAWDPGSQSKLFALTAIWDGSRLRIPELGASFVRCFGTSQRGYAPAPLPSRVKP